MAVGLPHLKVIGKGTVVRYVDMKLIGDWFCCHVEPFGMLCVTSVSHILLTILHSFDKLQRLPWTVQVVILPVGFFLHQGLQARQYKLLSTISMQFVYNAYF